MKNQNNLALTCQGKGKGKGKHGGNRERPSYGDENTISFGEGTNFIAKRRKSTISTVISVQIKI